MSSKIASKYRRTTIDNLNFLPVALRPYRPGEPERYETINTRTIIQISPPTVTKWYNSATNELTEANIDDPRYRVTFKTGQILEHGLATRADLETAGLPLPPEDPIAAEMCQTPTQRPNRSRRSRGRS